MENESIKSEHSSRSRRSKGHHNNTSNADSGERGSHRSGRHSHRKKRPDMAPFQTSVQLDDTYGQDGQEIIEVQILPQDENWGENTTAITGNTSEQSLSMDDLSNWQQHGGTDGKTGISSCQRYVETAMSLLLTAVAFVSPLAMVVLPKLGFFATTFEHFEITGQMNKQHLLTCNAECKGMLAALATRMVLLSIGLWALYLRQPIATLPRIFFFRATVLLLVLVTTFAYWLFYIVQVTEGTKALVDGIEAADYKSLVGFATSMADTLLFIHYIGVVLLELRDRQPVYYIKVVRSPDGESRSYSLGQLSIQRAAVWVLQKYYTDFPIYNPYLERVPMSKTQKKVVSSFKYYDVDGGNGQQHQSQSRAVLAAHARRRDSSHNERFYEESEYDRRVKKRKARLITAAEESFTHIRRMGHHETAAAAHPLDPHEAAQAVFPSMARALQKYLRVTRQQPRHSVEGILRHLAHCLKHDLSPRAFLEPYLCESPIMQNEKERQRRVQSWSLVSDELLSRPVSHGCTFQLCQNDVSLLVTVGRLPHFNVAEEVVDPKSNKFVLKLNSETSV